MCPGTVERRIRGVLYTGRREDDAGYSIVQQLCQQEGANDEGEVGDIVDNATEMAN